MFDSQILLRISKEVGAPVSRVETTLKLLEDGGTIPFIARYRKEATGNLDEVKIRDIDERRSYYRDLEERRATVLASIEKQGLLTDELKQRIAACFSRNDLEDLYLPFKPKRKTKASIAMEKGLEPLAEYIWAQTGADAVETFAGQFVNAEKQVASVEEAIEGAVHILAERISENAEFRRQLRDQMLTDGKVCSRVIKGKESEKTKYEMYYEFEEVVPKIPSHRMLAIRRGSRENILTFLVAVEAEKFITNLLPQVIRDPESPFAPLLERAVRDGYERLLEPSIQNETRSMLRERAEAEAIRVFEENLRTLLLAPPAGQLGVIGIDPGLRTGCKVAVVDQTGKFLENQTIFPTEPKKDIEGSEKILLDLVQRYNVRGIVIGNGTASRETESFVRAFTEKNHLDVFTVVVSESGASIYSASKRAREEFPSLDVTVRGAISIARRLQDPLAELVKIDPKSIGVGQYQHDVDQKKLRRSLAAAVESCVNRVGVDLNTASADLLRYVSGINDKLAQGIVSWRDQHGLFQSRMQLREVAGFGDKTFEQAAGFLRIKNGDNPLDRTAVHPETYAIVERMAESLGIPVGELIENPVKVNSVDYKNFESEAGKFTVGDIREELLKPGRDPRDSFVLPKYRDDVKEIADLKEGMELEGTVTNVTNFGAFVDLGVHQDGLVHISELSHKYIQDSREAVKVGEVVKVKVIGVDSAMKRIALSIKATQPKPERRSRTRKRVKAVSDQPVAQTPAAPAARAEQPAGPRIPLPIPLQFRRPQTAENIESAEGSEKIERFERTQKPRVEKKVAAPPPPPLPLKPRVETLAPPPPPQAKLSMEDKIRLLQEKFGRTR